MILKYQKEIIKEIKIFRKHHWVQGLVKTLAIPCVYIFLFYKYIFEMF